MSEENKGNRETVTPEWCIGPVQSSKSSANHRLWKQLLGWPGGGHWDKGSQQWAGELMWLRSSWAHSRQFSFSHIPWPSCWKITEITKGCYHLLPWVHVCIWQFFGFSRKKMVIWKLQIWSLRGCCWVGWPWPAVIQGLWAEEVCHVSWCNWRSFHKSHDHYNEKKKSLYWIFNCWCAFVLVLTVYICVKAHFYTVVSVPLISAEMEIKRKSPFLPLETW